MGSGDNQDAGCRAGPGKRKTVAGGSQPPVVWCDAACSAGSLSVRLHGTCFHCQETLLGNVRRLAGVLMEMLMPAYEFDAERDMTVLLVQGRRAAKLEGAFKPALLAVRGLQDSICQPVFSFQRP